MRLETSSHWRGLNTLQSATTISVTALQSASTLLCNECATEQSMLPHTGMKPLSPAHNIQRLSHLLFLLGRTDVYNHLSVTVYACQSSSTHFQLFIISPDNAGQRNRNFINEWFWYWQSNALCMANDSVLPGVRIGRFHQCC